jgi:peroxiredoxin Q/BCP
MFSLMGTLFIMKTWPHLLSWISTVSLFAAAQSVLAAPPHPALEGQIAPLFCGDDQDGRQWRLSEHIGKKMVFLYFYPMDDATGSTAEACNLRDNMIELRQDGVEVVGVSFNDKKTHRNFMFKYNLNFPLLADTCGSIADAYGVRMDAHQKLDRRVSFLIGLDGKIIQVTESPNPTVHIKELATALAKVREKFSL